MTITFLEAYALHGRNSMAIAEACGIDESDAYNLMAARADLDHGVTPVTAVGKRRSAPALLRSGGDTAAPSQSNARGEFQ
ncbi:MULTISPECIES: hypothetical protein [unclassified Shinella]|uniref:hypothetical protein n=1 Tax=unclassified Shinella TaxID=2643062 RepID=UPI00102D57F2|nr:hypothetical protein [Shinella sp. JR1-6]MCA0342970.1 hypothetical protein [Pseudomonadota bacterium]TAA54037.1 hypothetical protein EXZ48_27375 [Shinella sp. JR1-6]